jgi:UDP-glucose 4-epimerase
VPTAAATIGPALVARLPFLPVEAGLVHMARTSVVMDTGKAKALLGWTPKYNAAPTLEALAEVI